MSSSSICYCLFVLVILLIVSNGLDSAPTTNLSTKDTTSFSFRHHNNQEVNEILQDIHKRCPNITRLYELSERSINGWPLTVIEFSSSPGNRRLLQPDFRYVANMHGNEVLGRELLLKLADYLCEQYSIKNQEISRLINLTHIHLLPSMNPDGWDVATSSRLTEGDSGSNGESSAVDGGHGPDWLLGRNNLNGVDLNRDFPNPSDTSSDSSLDDRRELQPETRAVVKWIESTPSFVLSANLHGGSLVANYPYDSAGYTNNNQILRRKYSPTPDDDTFKSLALTYSLNHPFMPHAKKCDATDEDFSKSSGITNGAAWYSFNGGLQDFSYSRNDFDITIELGCDKYPPEGVLEKEWNNNRKSLLEYIWRIHSGVKGLVTDTQGNPVGNAIIKVKNVTSGRNQDIDHEVQSVGKTGEFWRLLTPGHYEVTVSKEGYLPLTKMITVNDEGHEEAKRVDFVLISEEEDAVNDHDVIVGDDIVVDKKSHQRLRDFPSVLNDQNQLDLDDLRNNILNNQVDEDRNLLMNNDNQEEQQLRDNGFNSYDFSNPELLDWTRVLAGNRKQEEEDGQEMTDDNSFIPFMS